MAEKRRSMKMADSVQRLVDNVARIRMASYKTAPESSCPAVYCPCDVLTVHVIRGRKVTNGYFDYVDTPDPYIQLYLKNAVIPKRRTKNIANCIDPKWDETFIFYIDCKEENILEIRLLDANYLGLDTQIGKFQYDIKDLVFDEKNEKTFTFSNGSEVDVVFTMSKDTEPADLRYSHDLCQQEVDFLKARKEVVFKNMQRMFGDEGPKTQDEVPNVSIIGSGGGFRAMVGLAGVFKALASSGILDISTYIGALSGSSWYLSILYSESNFPEQLSPGDEAWLQKFCEKIDQSLMWLLTPTHLLKYAGYLKAKSDRGQPVTFTDIFGLLVGETLIGDRMDQCLSDQRRVVDKGQVPLPLYSGLHVKDDVAASIFGDHVELSPYEVGMEAYGVYMDTELFGSAFYGGKLVKKFPEAKLHYVQGVLGSAFTILYNRLTDKEPKSTQSQVDHKLRHEMHEHMQEEYKNQGEENSEDDCDQVDNQNNDESSWTDWISEYFTSSDTFNTRHRRAAVIHSPLKQLSFKEEAATTGLIETGVCKLNKIFLVDAGLSFNSPFPTVLRQHRNVDLILSFDFSARESDDEPPFGELLLAELWARNHNKPFPPIDLTDYEEHGLQEVYVFEDPADSNCPIVLHFPLINKAFKRYKSPGVPRETEEDIQYADFNLFADGSTYSTFNFNYPPEEFHKMVKLMEFNTLYKMPEIKQAILRRMHLKRGTTTPMPKPIYEDFDDHDGHENGNA